MSGWMVKLLFHQWSKQSAMSWREQITFWRDSNGICFVLYQHAEFDVCGSSSL